MAGHRGDLVTQLMRERKQFIAPNKCCSSKYQAATTLLIPLAVTSRAMLLLPVLFNSFSPPGSASLSEGVSPKRHYYPIAANWSAASSHSSDLARAPGHHERQF